MRFAAVMVALLLGWGVFVGDTPPDPAQRATLPPTWTPTFTPTSTLTPTPTLTPTITPTLTREQACADFEVVDLGTGRRYYPYNATFALLFSTPLDGVTAQFFAVHRLSGIGVGLPDIERVDGNALNLPMEILPRHGLYDWRLELVDGDDEILCTQRGLFVAGFPVTATPSPTPNPNVTVVTATPLVIVVTATPE
jgi:hypothetical protein